MGPDNPLAVVVLEVHRLRSTGPNRLDVPLRIAIEVDTSAILEDERGPLERARVANQVPLGVVRGADSEVTRDAILDVQAIAAARKWRYNPATRDGVKVPVVVTIEMTLYPEEVSALALKARLSSPRAPWSLNTSRNGRALLRLYRIYSRTL